ncbi:MAG: hypothetical protein TE42_01260 [Candidatus Synechococcus spongiarum SP3]|uniref:Uncharacterized protein n=1 Tax=Candidatus Synechococcus spongiarum SP3 TaxID=1604020 RepID=A0A0G2HNS1_9SYNE|nr:MAG: hypothetical protein TE42_01260 [Candidatus Synechococcus spongiarum SP3]
MIQFDLAKLPILHLLLKQRIDLESGAGSIRTKKLGTALALRMLLRWTLFPLEPPSPYYSRFTGFFKPVHTSSHRLMIRK